MTIKELSKILGIDRGDAAESSNLQLSIEQLPISGYPSKRLHQQKVREKILINTEHDGA
jgi:hypothetical protein